MRSLPHLALEAPELTDTMCWAALERGDINGFQRCVSTAVALRDFTAAAGLLPWTRLRETGWSRVTVPA